MFVFWKRPNYREWAAGKAEDLEIGFGVEDDSGGRFFLLALFTHDLNVQAIKVRVVGVGYSNRQTAISFLDHLYLS